MTGRLWDSSTEMKRLMAEIAARLEPTFKRHTDKYGPPVLTKRHEEVKATFVRVSERFARGDFRHTSHEAGHIAEFCQLLANLHAATNGHEAKVVTIIEAELIANPPRIIH